MNKYTAKTINYRYYLESLCQKFAQNGHMVSFLSRDDSLAGIHGTVVTSFLNLEKSTESIDGIGSYIKSHKDDFYIIYNLDKPKHVSQIRHIERKVLFIVFTEKYFFVDNEVDKINKRKKIKKYFFFTHRKFRFITMSSSSESFLRSIGIHNVSCIRPGFEIKSETSGTKSHIPSIYYDLTNDYKGSELVILSLRLIIKAFPQTKLFINGNGNIPDKILELAEIKKVKDNIEFLPSLSSKEREALISASWINMNTSLGNDLELSILESTFLGTPTIGYDVPGVSDLIASGENGFKVESYFVTAYAEAAIEIMKNYARYSLSTLNYAKHFKWDKVIDEWEVALNFP